MITSIEVESGWRTNSTYDALESKKLDLLLDLYVGTAMYFDQNRNYLK